jgi:transposase
MTIPTTNDYLGPVSEVLPGRERRRRWSAEEKLRMVEETDQPGRSVSLVARRYGIAPNQLFRWKRLIREGGLSAVGAEDEVVPASEYRALQHVHRPKNSARAHSLSSGEVPDESHMQNAGCLPVQYRRQDAA